MSTSTSTIRAAATLATLTRIWLDPAECEAVRDANFSCAISLLGEDSYIRAERASDEWLWSPLLELLASDAEVAVRVQAAGNRRTPRRVIEALKHDEDAVVRRYAESNTGRACTCWVAPVECDEEELVEIEARLEANPVEDEAKERESALWRDDRELALWKADQRVAFTAGTLTTEQVRLLDEIPEWTWELTEEDVQGLAVASR